jgi:hypothetical protein
MHKYERFLINYLAFRTYIYHSDSFYFYLERLASLLAICNHFLVLLTHTLFLLFRLRRAGAQTM